ncbi:hypothetical protein AB0E62_21465 [Streptomyces sp. NPDC038707]|uniref:hypothetical protein n=1 Tax=Streptomyces sp. NPDC038707 TaxID=3154329 RepID=UPI0033CF49AC
MDDDRTVVSLMAGVAADDLRRTLATGAPVVRAIPLPAVRERRSVTVTCPSRPAVESPFERLGGTLPVADEDAFDVFSALTGTLTAHYAYLATLTAWATGHGIAADAAERCVRDLFRNVGHSLRDETRPLHRLAADHGTPNGNNERIRTTWFSQANAAALEKALDGLLADLGQDRPRGKGFRGIPDPAPYIPTPCIPATRLADGERSGAGTVVMAAGAVPVAAVA